MNCEEYDWFLDDPSAFIFRYHLPSICGWLNGLKSLLPFSFFVTSALNGIRSYCKKLIDTAGENDGFILDAVTGMDDAKIENL
jgi:hypothetical protein